MGNFRHIDINLNCHTVSMNVESVKRTLSAFEIVG